jgi:hypothetical protein
MVNVPLGCVSEVVGLLTCNADVDDAVAALEDPTGGRGLNGSITRELEKGGAGEKSVLESAV